MHQANDGQPRRTQLPISNFLSSLPLAGRDINRSSYRFSGSVIVVGAAYGNATRFQMSTTWVAFDRMLSVVTLDVLALPVRIHRTTRI